MFSFCFSREKCIENDAVRNSLGLNYSMARKLVSLMMITTFFHVQFVRVTRRMYSQENETLHIDVNVHDSIHLPTAT